MTRTQVLELPVLIFSRETPRRALLAAVAAIAAIWPTWPALAHVWNDNADYGHGLLVALISLVWLVRSASRLQVSPNPRSWRAALLLAAVLCAWLIAFKANVEIAKQATAPLIVWLAIATGAGWRAAARLWAPLCFFYFAVPVWDFALPLLQWLTVVTTQAFLGVLGIPVQIDGVIVTIPEGRFIVEEGCSGKRYFMIALAMSWLLARITEIPPRQTRFYVATAGVMALLANWIRVNIVIYAGHVTAMKHYFVAREHITLGWLIFVILLALVAYMSRWFRSPEDQRSVAATAANVSGAPESAGNGAGLLISLALLCVPVLALAFTRSAATAAAALPTSVISPPAGWRSVAPPPSEWQPNFSGASRELRDAFESGRGEIVEAYRASYSRQEPGAELIHYLNRVTGAHWNVIDRTHAVLTIRDGRKVSLVRVRARSVLGQLWLVDYFYEVGGATTDSEWLAQLRYGLQSWFSPAPSSVVALATQCVTDCSNSRTMLDAFWSR